MPYYVDKLEAKRNLRMAKRKRRRTKEVLDVTFKCYQFFGNKPDLANHVKNLRESLRGLEAEEAEAKKQLEYATKGLRR